MEAGTLRMLVTIVDVGVEVAVMSRAARHPSDSARVAGVSKVSDVTPSTFEAALRFQPAICLQSGICSLRLL